MYSVTTSNPGISRKRGRRAAGAAYHHGDLRSALLTAAGSLLEAEGPAALSLREAARRAGVSHAAPYRHFPDREALLAALAAQGFEALGEQLRATGETGARAIGVAYLRFALAQPQRYRLMFGVALSLSAHADLRRAAEDAYNALARGLPPGDARAARASGAAAWALVHGLASLLIDGHLSRAAADAGGDEALVREALGVVRFARAAPSAMPPMNPARTSDCA